MSKAYVFGDDETGVRIVLTNTFVTCARCGQLVPMADVGMRRMRKERLEFRNQPRCCRCRHATKRKAEAEA